MGRPIRPIQGLIAAVLTAPPPPLYSFLFFLFTVVEGVLEEVDVEEVVDAASIVATVCCGKTRELAGDKGLNGNSSPLCPPLPTLYRPPDCR